MSESKYSPSQEEDKHKKEEERKVWLQEEWKKNPEKFVHQDEIILAAIKAENGIGTLIGKCGRPLIEIAAMRLIHKAFQVFTALEMHQMMENKSQIATPPESGKIIV